MPLMEWVELYNVYVDLENAKYDIHDKKMVHLTENINPARVVKHHSL